MFSETRNSKKAQQAPANTVKYYRERERAYSSFFLFSFTKELLLGGPVCDKDMITDEESSNSNSTDVCNSALQRICAGTTVIMIHDLTCILLPFHHVVLFF